jgi:predicted NBD/HSP70 family sugar kinase
VRIGIDIGGTKTDVVAVDAAGGIAHQLRVASGFGPEGVVATTVDAVLAVAKALGVSVDSFDSIGVGIPGVVTSGRVAHAMNLGLNDLDLASALGAALGRDVAVENDVNAAALGAWQLVDHRAHSIAYLNLGTGLAAGLVLDGRLWRGSRGTAGEIGHILVDPAGPVGPDGQRGGLETLASGSGLSAQWPSDAAHPVRELLAAAAAGDERAVAIRSGLFEGVASAVRILVLTIDVERVIIGGGISNLGDELLAGVRAVFDRWSLADSPFVGSLDLADRISIAPHDVPLAAVGAALVGAAPKEN